MTFIIFLIIFIYLLFQAIKDAKTGMVYYWLNILALIFAFALWGISFLKVPNKTDELVNFFLIFIVLFLSSINLGKIKKIMQPSDAKAFLVVYMSSCYTGGFLWGIFAVFISIIVSHTFFIFWHRLIKKNKKEDRKAYFPFILIGYSSTVIYHIFISLKGLNIF